MAEVRSGVHPSDQELVSAVQCGDVAAFGSLVARYDGQLRGSLTRQTGDPELAADLVQDAFVAAFQHIDRLNGEDSFAAWLHRIARNRLQSEWRRRALRRFISLDWLSAGVAAAIPALRSSDDSQVWHERDAIQGALDALSPSLRDALVLNRLGGFTHLEVASILGISSAAAQKRISRAALEFARHYDEANHA